MPMNSCRADARRELGLSAGGFRKYWRAQMPMNSCRADARRELGLSAGGLFISDGGFEFIRFFFVGLGLRIFPRLFISRSPVFISPCV